MLSVLGGIGRIALLGRGHYGVIFRFDFLLIHKGRCGDKGFTVLT